MVFIAAVSFSVSAADTEKPAQSDQTIEEILVRSKKTDRFTVTLEAEKLMNVAGSFGDPLQGVFSLPGIVQADEESGAPAVRGSGPEDNSFLIDFLPAGYVFHEFGNSIFNENLIRDFGLKSAGFGPRYGQALGAVFDIDLREPKFEPIETTIDASFLRSGFFVEGQVAEKQSFYVGYRESLIHLFVDSDEEDGVRVTSQPRSKDYQGKYYWEIDDANSISFLALGAGDEAGQNVGANSTEALLDPAGIGNQQFSRKFDSQGINWKHQRDSFNAQVALGHITGKSKFRYGPSERLNLVENTWTLKGEVQKTLSDTHTVAVGGQFQKQEYDYNIALRLSSCSDFDPSCEFDLGVLTQSRSILKQDTWNVFFEDGWRLSDNWVLTGGLHHSANEYLNESHTDPRIRLDWQVNEDLAFHTSAGRYHQPPRVDQVIPVFGTPSLESPTSNHYVVGMDYAFNDEWSLQTEAYYKSFDDLVVSQPGAGAGYSNNAEGEAYGLEFMLDKAQGDSKWYGWLSIAYARTERTNNLTGETAKFYTDTPFVVNWVMNYQMSELWSAGIRWNYRSGLPYTPIVGNHFDAQEKRYEPVYGALNSQRAGAYHRLDIRFERQFDNTWVDGSFYIDIINTYGATNSGAVEYEPLDSSGNFVLTEEDSLGLFPSIGVKLQF